MRYFAVSYHSASDKPLGKDGQSILLLSKHLYQGIIGPTIQDGGDLPIRNILIEDGLINREDFMVPEQTGTYKSEKETLEEVAQDIAEGYDGTIVKTKGMYLALNLEPEQSEKFHQNNMHLGSILEQPEMRRR